MINQREYRFDNIRAILMFLVVFGHLIQTDTLCLRGYVWRFIYAFHMPVFIFVSGCFAKPTLMKIIKHYIWPYVFFQTAWFYFQLYYLKNEITFQLTSPYVAFWYLMTVSIYYGIVSLFSSDSVATMLRLLGGAFLLSLLVGFDNTVGNYLSLSRTIALFPFFLIGYYRQTLLSEEFLFRYVEDRKVLITISLAVIFIFECCLLSMNYPISVLWYAKSYLNLTAFAARFCAWLISLSCIVLAVTIIPDKKISFLTYFGKNTMAVFLLHGFVVAVLEKNEFFRFNEVFNILLAMLISMLIMFAFGNSKLNRLFKLVF